jgi:23S rRNA (uracil1939-C5)-methyltransferase
MKLRIEKAIYGGDGLTHSPDGKAVFVAGTLPGELVEATIAQQSRGFSTGALQTVLEPSADRVIPGCEYFPVCGGCQYQHATAALQLRMKMAILQETMARAHLAVPEEIGSVAGSEWGYRNRVRLHVVKVPSGIALGYRQRGSHNLLPVAHCPIAAPLLQQAIAAVTRIGVETGLTSLCDEVEFFTNGEQDQLLLSLWPGPHSQGRKREDKLEQFAERLHTEIPLLTGVGLISSGQVAYWGQRFLTYRVAGFAYRVSMGGFFQVNRFLLPQLLELVLQGSHSGGTAWDLYAGAGLFARALPYEHVTAVESAGFSADDLQHNVADKPAAKKQRTVRSSTLDFLRKPYKVKPDLILVDPPRAGLGKETCNLLGVIGAARIVSISCDPATLARDLQSLLPFGYAIESIHLVDLFPQTFHMETVTFLKRT